MATKIVRKTASIFGLNAGSNQLAVFGSLAAAAPAFSTDPAVIQSLSQWADGWFAAVIGANSPAIEDMNSFCYVDSYQIAYLMQQGVAEWDSATNYFIGSFVSLSGVLYVSNSNSNFNNNPSTDSGANWSPFVSGIAWQAGVTYPAQAVVSYSGALYLSLVAGNLGNTPTDVNHWILFQPGALNPQVTSTLAVIAASTGVSSTAPDTSALYTAMAFSPELNLQVAVASSAPTHDVATSANGKTWTGVSSGVNTGGAGWDAICWSPALGIFCAVGSGTNAVMTSPDGSTWTAHAGIFGSWGDVCWAPELGLFVAVGVVSGNGAIMTSPDGSTWTARTSPATNHWVSVCYSSKLGLLVAVSYTGTSQVMVSSDGITWTLEIPAATQAWVNVRRSDELGLFVACSASGSNPFMFSRDGLVWTSSITAASGAWNKIAFSPELRMWLAVGTNLLAYSPDGMNWTLGTSPANKSWYALSWSGVFGLFSALSQDGSSNSAGMFSKYVKKFIAP